jgi:uncharacterized protein (UPF0332 family)
MQEAIDLWNRAWRALLTARTLARNDPDASASRSYYAAFHASSALFAAEGRTFSRHSALEAAVHRDLVKSGRWAQTLGQDYSLLRGLRQTGDYGGGMHVAMAEAEDAILAAERIVKAVHASNPDLFIMP